MPGQKFPAGKNFVPNNNDMTKKNKQLWTWLAIGAALVFVVNKKSSAAPIADNLTATTTGDPAAEYLQPGDVPPVTQTKTYSGIES